MKPHEVILAVEATSSKLEKEELLVRAWHDGHRDLFVGARMAYDKLRTFGVKKVPRIDEDDDGASGRVTFVDFLGLTSKLEKRELTGHAARDAIEGFLNAAGIAEWNGFYRRVLLKDLRCGITESTINKALKAAGKTDKSALEYIVPVFACQLAPSESYNRETIMNLRGRALVDVKYDGMRLVTVLDKMTGEVTQYSRNGLVNSNFPHIVEALTNVMGEIPRSIVVDGEIVGDSFRTLMREATRPDGETTGTTLMIFDVIPLDDFRKGHCDLSQELRHEVLTDMAGLFQKHGRDSLFVLPKADLDLDTEEGRAALKEMFEEVMRMRETDPKVEGLITKRPDAPYRCKRWNGWEKVKPYVDASLAVVGLEQGKEGTKNENSLGAIVCRGIDGGRAIEVRVGSGFTDEERKLWWENPDLIMGLIAEVEGHEFSQDMKAEGTNKWSIRHPRLKGWRGSKPGQKL